ncbi:MAG TPA: lanthionine synthetase LanC family protein [Myxococcaceae bacterium]|nr:lanthionine synthetase LanC family protein [Myxococcaceae bacterium]
MGEAGRFAEVACRLGRRLCRDAIWSGGRCNWLGFTLARSERGWTVGYRALDPTLGEGTAGIAVFLARLADSEGDPILRDTAEAAGQRVRDALAEAELPVGFHEGRAGMSWALTEIGRLLQREDLLVAGLGELARLASAAQSEEVCGLGRGIAGVALALLSGPEGSGGDDLLQLGLELGQLLVARSVRSTRGCTWPTQNRFGASRLLGYAHGPSGIASVLLRLQQATGRRGSISTVAWRAFDFERTFQDPRRKTWPESEVPLDGRSSVSEPRFPRSWCHGAAGIGMARLAATGAPRPPASVAADTETAIELCRASALAPIRLGDASPCHGLTGTLEMLLLVARRQDHPGLNQLALEMAERLAEHQRGDIPWQCGLPGLPEIPGVLLGLAGIGDFYLRLARPDRFTSLLTLEGACA